MKKYNIPAIDPEKRWTRCLWSWRDIFERNWKIYKKHVQ